MASEASPRPGEGPPAPSGSAVFAGLVRSCAAHLPGVFRNLERLGALYESCAIVFVENDSEDDTRRLLQEWAAQRPNVHILNLDGLSERTPHRTGRLAICRNAYLDFIRSSPYATSDHLVLFDGDDVFEGPVDPEEFRRAKDWLASHEKAVAVFANSSLVYYDIWALRHPTWCPSDCLDEARRASKRLTRDEARQKYVAERQIPIDRHAEPIPVESAFGGLAIYELGPALGSGYDGVGADGKAVCEHVAFNQAIVRQSGGGLFILPWLRVTPTGSKGVPMVVFEKVQVEQGGVSFTLRVPPAHPIAKYREGHPLYDRRLPILARLLSEHDPEAAAIDVGANIGDTVALCRAEGSQLRFVAVEAALTYYKLLLINRRKQPQLFGNVEPVWKFVGVPGDVGRVELRAGTAHKVEAGSDEGGQWEQAPTASLEQIATSAGVLDDSLALVKIDTDGHDQTIILNDFNYLKRTAPVIWAEAQTASDRDEADWARILTEGAETWPYVVAFDNYGFAYCAGSTAKKRISCIDLISYARRHRQAKKSRFGAPTVYYADIALFPARFGKVFNRFVKTLPEFGRADETS